MATIKTSELTGKALDYAVALCEGVGFIGGASQEMREHRLKMGVMPPDYSTNWAQGGPIIDKLIGSGLQLRETGDSMKCSARIWDDTRLDFTGPQYGKTPLLAAMRCFVASKMGYSVEIPDELLKA